MLGRLVPATGLLRAVPPGLRDVASLAGGGVGTAAQLALQVPVAAAGAVASSVPALRREVVSETRALTDLRPGRTHRRVWSGHGHAHIEVRGMTGRGPQHQRLAAGVKGQIGRLRGVRWAEVNAVSGQVLVAFDDRRIDVGDLLRVVRSVETAEGTREENFSWSRPLHPSDNTPIAAAAVELAGDCLALTASLAAKVMRLPAAPRGVRVVQALLEVEPPLRRMLKRRVGPMGTDLVLALTAAGLQGLTQGPALPAVDALFRLELLAEAVSRRRVWERRESELCCSPKALPREATVQPARPQPRPRGPIEDWVDRLGPATLGGAAAVLALTRSPSRAADTILAAVPKAARFGREGFATTVGRGLANRGVVPLNAAAWRRLDRVSAIIVDSPVLCTGGTDGAEPELDSLADAIVNAARSSGARLLLTRHGGVGELVPRADEILTPARSVADHVLRLQGEGHGVLVISATNDQALAAADVGVAVLTGNACRCWSADLLCGPGLAEVWRLLQAVAVARPVSKRAVQLAQAGSSLGGLLALVGGRGGQAQATAPVYGAALLSLLQGTLAGLRVIHRSMPQPVPHVPWHALDPWDVFASLDEIGDAADTTPTDGSTGVARLRAMAAHLADIPPGSGFLRPIRTGYRLSAAVREELHDPLTPVLAVGAAASAIVGSSVDALLVTAVMCGNALVSGLQRVRAEQALHRLLLQQEVVARRLPRQRPSREDTSGDALFNDEAPPLETVPAKALRPGDVIALRSPDVVPADARLLSAADLEVDESTLTGESLPVEKGIEATPDEPLAERRCMVFEGTTVVSGRSYAVVVATGDSTEAGKAAQAASAPRPAAGIQARLAELTRLTLPVTAIGGAVVTGLGVLRGLRLRPAVAAGVSVAVAAVPEGLPLVATVAQAAAARRLSRSGVVVRSSRTLEALGRVDVVCFDKTGTLTEGRLAVTRLASVDGDLEMADPTAQHLLATAARACPPADPEATDTVTHATDRAVLDAARKLVNSQTSGQRNADWKLLAELPFETNRGYSASLGTQNGGRLLVAKGAPEVLLPACRRVASGSGESTLSAASRRAAQRTLEHLAGEGLRVLAVAERSDGIPTQPGEIEDLISDLTLLGFVGVADTPRRDAAAAVRRMSDAGVRTVMITGDHPTTAAAIARSVGMPAGTVMTGTDLDEMTAAERVRRVAETTVFARVSPEQKVRIVEAMRAGGSVVAMTGDGANDAAAIRLADVGIGVAATGSTAARSAADLVLASADIQRIHDATLEGRDLWHRIGDAISILVGGNAGEVAFMIFGTAVSGQAPLNVRQLLIVNMLTDMFPALAVAVAEPGNGSPADGPTAGVLGAPLARAVAIRGGATALGASLAWIIGRCTGRRRRAGSMGLAALVGTQLGQTLLVGWRSPLIVATALASAAALFAAIQTPGLSQFFGSTPIGPVAWAVVLGSAALGTVAAALAARIAEQRHPART